MNANKWVVYVDVDAKGGDDDVHSVCVTVEAPDRAAAMKAGEALVTAKFGELYVLGAWNALKGTP